MQKKLTKLQAYNVMLKFLENLYEKERSDYLGNILSNSEFLSDKIPGDQASWADWKNAIHIVALQDKSLLNQNKLTQLQACRAMFNYVHNYIRFYIKTPDYFVELLKTLQSLGLKQKTHIILWQEWLHISNEIIKKDDPRVYLKFEA